MKERRKCTRSTKSLPIKLRQAPDKDFDLATETKNISANGAYCAVSQPIALMTKLKLTLLIPQPKTRVKKIKKITCQGVVVRKENIPEDKKYPYRIGIFFHDIDNQDKKFLHLCVNSWL